MFPASGTNGWEAFGTLVTTLPIAYPLPVAAKAYYYDPVRLHGIGPLCDSVVLTFAAGTCVVRHRRMTSEAEFTLTNVWDDALLDEYVLEPQGAPCSLVLDIYDDDRETILWSVGSDPEHAAPFLVEPTAYAEQEIDVAAGSATLGTVTVEIVDKNTIPGDQDSGFLTARLAAFGLADITGRRARLRRFISEDQGWVVLADGPAGTPQMESSYASFSFGIRDTRETERKIRIFPGENDRRGILPQGDLAGYGYDPIGATWLIDPLAPLGGVFHLGAALQHPDGVLDITENTAARRTVDELALNAGLAIGRQQLRWRAYGSSDPWTVFTTTFEWEPSGASYHTTAAIGSGGATVSAYLIVQINVADRALGSLAVSPYLPADEQHIEFIIDSVYDPAIADAWYRQENFKKLVSHVDGLTAGQFVQNVYDGIYSPRAENGDPIPTGILYDPLALAQMTDLVRIRLLEAVPDARDWLEKTIYAPTGWVPALDDLGRISPVSQVPPSDLLALKNINNANSEPSPDWNAGDRIVNVLTYTYQRDYRPSDPTQADGDDGLASRDVVMEFRDEPSITRNGEQTLDIDGSAFRAIGTSEALAVTTVDAELGYQLAYLRDQYVKWRYALGAPAFSLGLWRISLPTLRCGEWVSVDLSWLPDYITGRRGLVGLGQVVSIGDLDCCWRRGLIELVAVPAEEGYS